MAGVEVKLTRSNDVFVDLQRRCDIANDWDADYFISIHCNSAASAQAHGMETYAYKHGSQGEKLARAVHGELVKACGLTDRGVKFANYYVLRKTSMPAILTELAFISNSNEERLLNSPGFHDKCAAAIVRGIAKVINIQVTEGVDTAVFKDITGHWAQKDIEEAEKLGLVAGKGDGTFAPDENITRAEVVVLLMRLCQLVKGSN